MSATISPGYAGFDPSISHGYISNGELLAWLSQVSGDKWDEMRDLMMATNARHEVMEDLENLRSAYDQAAEDKNLNPLVPKLQELITKYEGTPYESAIKDLAQPRLDAANAVLETYREQGESREANNRNDGFVDQLDTMGKEAERMGDQLGRDDQMTMIRIQELKDGISQQVSLTSTMIKSDDEAKSAIIMNMKG
ncbi:MAG: hypothetical protein M3020_23545 [Myxococcota bacterium]|jgi:phosphoketolase|nr:hypothetical protein [Myxococcota bacterium]